MQMMDIRSGWRCWESCRPLVDDSCMLIQASNCVQKRDMYVGLARRAHRMLEVVFNAGHSATLALIANPTLEYHALDLCQHNYTRRCFQLLMFRFPGRVSMTCGDSTVRLRELELERWVPPRWR